MKFKPTGRIKGFIYIIDTDSDSLVSINGKRKRFKTTSKCAEFIYNLERAYKMQNKE